MRASSPQVGKASTVSNGPLNSVGSPFNAPSTPKSSMAFSAIFEVTA